MRFGTFRVVSGRFGLFWAVLGRLGTSRDIWIIKNHPQIIKNRSVSIRFRSFSTRFRSVSTRTGLGSRQEIKTGLAWPLSFCTRAVARGGYGVSWDLKSPQFGLYYLGRGSPPT